jgi:C-terminal processing protease CtpA/Prc
MTRAVVPLDSLFGFRRVGEEGWDYCVDPKARIGYVWVKSLKSSTLHELAQLERRLDADGMRGLVLDFRFSQGDGHLHDAALVADGLIDGGLMWTARETHYPAKEFRADRECLFRDWPLVVLVNGVQDNAQGAVLAAFQDSRRATLVGEPTRTDGAIRRAFPLPNDQGIITVLTGGLERADRKRGWPVRPDRLVELSKEQRSVLAKWLMSKQFAVLPPGTDDRPPEDPQLAAGVALLRERLKSEGRK